MDCSQHRGARPLDRSHAEGLFPLSYFRLLLAKSVGISMQSMSILSSKIKLRIRSQSLQLLSELISCLSCPGCTTPFPPRGAQCLSVCNLDLVCRTADKFLYKYYYHEAP